MRKIVTAVALAALLAGCAYIGELQSRVPQPPRHRVFHASRHAKDLSQVIPREHGEYDVVSHWKTRNQAEAWALEMAQATCSGQGQQFVVLTEQVEYKGVVPEQVNRDADVTRNNIPVPIVRNIFIPDLRDANDYQVGLHFRCDPFP